MPPPEPKIYHILHCDRLRSVINDQALWCDERMIQREASGTAIGMNQIKLRRLNKLQLSSHPGLYVGQCVPFYFCPRSIMLYVIHRANHTELQYRGGQECIVHLEADLYSSVTWAREHDRRWAFTLSNAGSLYFEDRADLAQLDEIDWAAVHSNQWAGSEVDPSVREGKQAEFLLEREFPWHLIERIGVYSETVRQTVLKAIAGAEHRPKVQVVREWYY